MRNWRLIVFLFFLMVPHAAGAQSRIALVIGNGAYQNASALANPVNDANDISGSLKRLGFDVTTLNNATFEDMRRAVIAFGRKARGTEFAVVFFAGHGMEVGGENWLIPVDAQLSTDLDVANETIGLQALTRAVSTTTKLGLIILDACRNNPFAPKMQRSSALSRAVDRGFARVEPNDNVLVAYAARDGTTAKDGAGRNSPFTASLLKNIETPGLEVTFLFRAVRDDVLTATNREQQPYIYGSLSKESVYLNPSPANAGTGAPSRPPSAEAKPVAVAPKPTPPVVEVKPTLPALARADVVKLFEPFALVFNTVQKDFVEKTDPQALLAAAMTSMKATSPATTKIAVAGPGVPSPNGATAFDLNSVYDVGLGILNERTSDDDKAKLVVTAMNGMLAGIDVYAGYMDPKAFRDMQVQTRGQFGGLGIELTMDNGLLKVVSPLDGTPASRGGVLTKDLITHLDDVSVRGLTLTEAVSKMRGAPGEKIKLRITRSGIDTPVEITLVREQIVIQSVRARVEANNLAYLKLTTFNEQTTPQLKAEIANLTTKIGANKLKGFILDLRNNPGGLLEEGVNVADAFLERGEIVSTRGRNAEDTQRRAAQPGDLTKGKPLIVLINGGAASVSEVVAAALQDHKRAKLVGSRTFGKGSVQTIIPLGTDKGALRLTTARYFTPSGKSIQARGIDPDVEVLQDGSDGTTSVPTDPKDDKALAAAVNLLNSQK